GVKKERLGTGLGGLLLMTFREKAWTGFHFRQTVHGWRQACELARPVGRRYGRQMGIAEQRMGFKWPCQKACATFECNRSSSVVRICRNRSHACLLKTIGLLFRLQLTSNKLCA